MISKLTPALLRKRWERIAELYDPSEFMPYYHRLITQTCAALLAGAWTNESLTVRMTESFGTQAPWIRALVERVTKIFPAPRSPIVKNLEVWLHDDEMLFRTALHQPPSIVKTPLTPTSMSPSPWPVPKLTTDADLCQWLDISHDHLAWFTAPFAHTYSRKPLQHYYYKWLRKRSGGWRLLEIPKAKLKTIQRRILADVLDKIPPHSNAHGFAKGRLIAQFIAPHVQRDVVLRMDLKDFFPSVRASRVHALFRTAGYSEHIARMLTALCTNQIPAHVLHLPNPAERLSGPAQLQLRISHLPQGAPTSPALANLSAFRFDSRVSALAQKFGWSYTRYADDLLFSGKRFRPAFMQQFQLWVGAIAKDERFEVNTRKTRAMPSHVRQHAVGLVLNEKPNISRTDFDTLKAILHNCAKSGPDSQNRNNEPHLKAHLAGRISHIRSVNSQKADRLQLLYEKIPWTTISEP